MRDARCCQLSKSLNNLQFLSSEPPYALKKNQLEMLCLPLERRHIHFPAPISHYWKSKKLSLKFGFKFQVEVRYNVPSTRGESCKFDLNITVKEIKEPKVGNLFGPVEDEPDDDNEKGKKNDKGGINRCKKLKGKKAKRKCRKEEKEKQKRKNKNKSNKNKRPPPKHQPVKSIHLKVCTR